MNDQVEPIQRKRPKLSETENVSHRCAIRMTGPRSYDGEYPRVFDRHTFQVFFVVTVFVVFRAFTFLARQIWFRLGARASGEISQAELLP